MTSSIGLDIGGAHLKACLIKNDIILKLSKLNYLKHQFGSRKILSFRFNGD